MPNATHRRTRRRADPEAELEEATPATPAADTPELLSRREAAERAGVHLNTIRLWESQRLLRPKRVSIGRREEVRIDPAELDRVAAERREARPATAKAGALVVPAEELARQLADAGARLTATLERAARAEVEATMLRAQLEELRATLDSERQRNAQLVTALTERPATSRRWWQKAPG